MSASLIVSHPQQADHLFLLFHGVGATPDSLIPLAERIAGQQPQAAVVSVCAPYPSDLSNAGYQWFSVRGVTEENRPQRIQAVLAEFIQAIRDWQSATGCGAQNTTLIGFSQGAIMSLSLTQQDGDIPASRVVSLSGRFATLPDKAPAVSLHLLHGKQDGVMDWRLTQQAYEQLQQLGAGVTLDLFDDLGHSISAPEAGVLLNYLRN